MTPEDLAQLFHDTYERLAPDFGYRTREASAKPWAEVPAANKALMIATCAEVLTVKPYMHADLNGTDWVAAARADLAWPARAGEGDDDVFTPCGQFADITPPNHCPLCQLWGDIKRLVAELDDALAEAKGARDDYEQLKGLNAELAAERDRLQRELDRLRRGDELARPR